MFRHNPTLVGFLYGFLKLFGMSGVPPYLEAIILGESPSAINAYYETLIREYKLSGMARMEALVVEEVQLCKAKEAPYHEYISAKVTGPKNVDFCISFERFRGDKIPTGKETPANTQSDSTTPTSDYESSTYPPRTTQNAIPQDADTLRTGSLYNSLSDVSAASSQKSLDFIGGNRLADDKVQLLPASRRNKTDKVYRTLVFAKTPDQGRCLHFYELVILAHILHNNDNRYLIGTKQCYYYAGTIIKVLQEVHEEAYLTIFTTGSTELDQDNRITARNPKKDRAGKWGKVPIYAGLSSSEVAPLCQMYIEATNTFKKTVSKAESERQRMQEELRDTKSTLLQREEELAVLRRELAIKSGAPTISDQ